MKSTLTEALGPRPETYTCSVPEAFVQVEPARREVSTPPAAPSRVVLIVTPGTYLIGWRPYFRPRPAAYAEPASCPVPER
jgi:hypothetical protein